MPKVKGPLFSLRASGKIGERLIFSERKTGHQARFQRKQKDRKSFEQFRNREVYFDAVGLWRKLSEEEKNYWRRQAVGRSLTGFNLFVKNYYMNTIRKLATVKDIDLKTLGTTPLYTVPTGCKVVVIGVVLRTKIFETVNGDGNIFILQRSNDDVFLISDTSGLDNPDYFLFIFVEATGGLSPVIPAGDGVDLKVESVDTGEGPLVVDADVIGYLIEG